MEDLEGKFQDLNESLLAEMHAMIQPYILRRIKADVLRLPPKVGHPPSLCLTVKVVTVLILQVEIIVPISLTPIQKQVYRSVLEKNAEFLQAMLQQKNKKAKVAIVGGGPVGKKKVNGNGVKETEAQVVTVAGGDAVGRKKVDGDGVKETEVQAAIADDSTVVDGASRAVNT